MNCKKIIVFRFNFTMRFLEYPTRYAYNFYDYFGISVFENHIFVLIK